MKNNSKFDIRKYAHQKVNIVLSGGGTLGVAHAAFLEFLEEHHVEIVAISGSSSGALTGGLYASGLSPNEIFDFYNSTPLFKYTWLNPRLAGIFNTEKYHTLISPYMKKTFQEVNIKLYVTTTNMEQNKTCRNQTGELIPAVLASCAVPAIFSPVEINGELHSDGGITDNFPIAPFEGSPYPTIGSYLGSVAPKEKKELGSIFKVVNHANNLLLHSANITKLTKIDHTYCFPLSKYGIFDSQKINDIYNDAKTYLKTTLS